MFTSFRARLVAVRLSLSSLLLVAFIQVLLPSCGGRSHVVFQRPTAEELKALFPRYANGLKYSEEEFPKVGIDNYAGQVEKVWRPDIATTAFNDVDGDGSPEFAFIATWIKPVS